MGVAALGQEPFRLLSLHDLQRAGRPERARTSFMLTNDQLCQLVASVASNRDRQAFARLFEYFVPRLRGFGLRRGVDPTTADELAQETMLTVWRKSETFDPQRATVSTWIFTIVRNKRIDMFRRQGYPTVDLDEVADTPSDEPAADASLSAEEAFSTVRAAMRSLPREQREILRKAYFEEKSHRAIAEELGLPLGTVKSRIRLALARLRLSLPEGDE